jgi:hypothetical protein
LAIDNSAKREEISSSGSGKMKTVGIILWIICSAITAYWIIETRRKAGAGLLIPPAIVNQCMFLTTSIVIVPIAGISPYNLLWMIPSSFVLGFLFVIPPFAIITYIPASIFAAMFFRPRKDLTGLWICPNCNGVNPHTVSKCTYCDYTINQTKVQSKTLKTELPSRFSRLPCLNCTNYERNTGACKEIHENVRDYPNRFSLKCNGKYYKRDEKAYLSSEDS